MMNCYIAQVHEHSAYDIVKRLKRGQFFRVGDRFTSFMNHKAKSKRDSAKAEALFGISGAEGLPSKTSRLTVESWV